jgi:hypothetical protein
MQDQVGFAAWIRRTDLVRELLSIGTLTVAFALFAALSWRTWPDILVDFGQELYVPWRLTQGDALYRDIAWVGGPLSQYWNALLFQLFGVSLTTIIFANLALLAAIVGMLYGFFRRCGTRASATMVGLFYLAVFAFAQYSLIGNYNYICPYRHETTHGLALGLINLHCLVHFGRTRMKRWLAASGLCLGLLILVKIELALAAVLTTVAALLLYGWQGRHAAFDAQRSGPQRAVHAAWNGTVQGARWSAILIAMATLPVLFTVAGLAWTIGWLGAIRGTFAQYRLALDPRLSSQAGFYRAVAGWDRPAENLQNMAFWTAIVLAALTTGHILEVTLGRRKRPGWVVTAFGIVIACVGFGYVTQAEWLNVPTCLPVLLLVVIGTSLRRAVSETRPGMNSALCLAAIFGLVLLPKIILRVGWAHYGFALAMPGTLVVVHVAVHTIPDWWRERRYSGRWFQALAVGVFAGAALSLVHNWVRIDGLKTVAVGEKGDRFYSVPIYDGRTIPTVQTLAWLKANVHADDTLIVFPNGCMLNYLLRLRNPTKFLMFNPWEFEAHGGEQFVTESILRAAPDYAVIVTDDMTIHGRGNFGDPEFGGEIRKFLDENYEIVDVQTSQDGIAGPFSSTVFKRRAIVHRDSGSFTD